VAFLAVAWVGVFVSCTVQRHREAAMQTQTASRITAVDGAMVTQSDSVRTVWLQRRTDQREVIAIAPVGQVRYHPDSGFAGEAKQVIIYRRHHSQADSADRLQRARTAKASLSQRDSALNTAHAQHRQASVVSAPVAGRWVLGVLLCLGALWFGWRYLGRFFR